MIKFWFIQFELETLLDGLQVMLYGLVGVFIVLILFYLVTKGLFVVANKLPGNKEG